MYMSWDSGLPLSRGLDCESDRQFLVWSREIGVFLTNVFVLIYFLNIWQITKTMLAAALFGTQV